MEENCTYAAFVALAVAAAAGVYLFFVRYKQHKSANLRWGKLLLGNLLVLLFVVALALVAGESYFRFGYDTTDSFALTKTCRRWFERHYRVNRMGYRDDCEYLPQRTPGKRRVTFVGDSFAAGHGIPDVADRFANRIRAAHPEWEVQVLAETGQDSGHELELLARLAQDGYEFDEVVLVYCLNDIGDASQELIDRAQGVDRACKQRKPGFWFEHSYLLNTLYYRLWMVTLPEISDYYGYQQEAYIGRAWDAHTPRLKAIRDIVREGGGDLCVITFPYLHSLGPDYAFRDVHRRLDGFWKDLGVAHLDLLPVYESYASRELVVNRHDAHPNALAHKLAAEAVARFLAAQPRLAQDERRLAAEQVSPSRPVAERLIDCYEEILQADPGNVGAHVNLGNALWARGKAEDAIAHYRRAVRIDAGCVAAHSNLARVLAAAGKLDAAAFHSRRATELQPEAADFWVRLGGILFRQGRLDEALIAVRRALQCKPDDVTAHYNLGFLLSRGGRLDEAVQHYRRVLELEPDHAAARLGLEEILRQHAPGR